MNEIMGIATDEAASQPAQAGMFHSKARVVLNCFPVQCVILIHFWVAPSIQGSTISIQGSKAKGYKLYKAFSIPSNWTSMVETLAVLRISWR